MPSQKYYLVAFTCIFVYLLLPFRSSSGNKAETIVLPDMPGVGISLTASYAVVSLRKDDGAFEDVTRVESDEEYAEMMKRLSALKAQRAR
jgi:hypothetical protein